MKRNLLSIRYIIFTLLLILLGQQIACAQETVMESRSIPGLFFGFSGGPTQTKIINSGSIFDTSLVVEKGNSFSGTAEIGYFFSDYIGISSGIDYVSYKSKLKLKSFQNNFNTVDSENEAFTMMVTGSGIEESQTISFLSIPLCVHLRLPLNSSFGLFLKGGVNLSLPVNKKYSSSGVFTYKGYYPAYNVVLENLPLYGFATDKTMGSNGELDLKMVRFNTLVSAGLDVNITESVQVAFGASFTNSLLKESYSSSQASTSISNFQLTPNTTKINSFMQGSSKATAQSVGFDITLRFFIQ